MASSIYRPGHYHLFAEVTSILHAWAGEHPGLASVESIGRCLDGKDVWMLTLTARGAAAAGGGVRRRPEHKPALWCDGNTHANEVASCEACLHFASSLIDGWRAGDARITECLERATVYIVPRISADGAEYTLTTPYAARSSPVDVQAGAAGGPPGFVADDIDRNGALLSMRQAHPAGGYKVSRLDRRLMVRRRPEERVPGEVYYRLWPEGRFEEGYDGFDQKPSRSARGPNFTADLNRQFPFEFRPTATGGPYPNVLPQGRAVVEALTRLGNVCIMQSCHTSGREILTLAESPEDKDRPGQLEGVDRGIFAALTGLGVEKTGYKLGEDWLPGDSGECGRLAVVNGLAPDIRSFLLLPCVPVLPLVPA